MNFSGTIDAIRTREDFINFLSALIDDLRMNPDSWENPSLERFLQAAMSWTEDLDGFYINTGQAVPTNVNWKVFADILAAARIYE